MWDSQKPISAFLTIFLVLTCIEVIGLYILISSHLAARLVPVREYVYTDSKISLDSFSDFLETKGFIKNKISVSQVIKLQQFIGGSIKKAGVYYGRERGMELYRLGSSGTPFACGSMALLMNDALSALGYKARLVMIYRTDFSQTDTHAVVEVYLGSKWVLFDPTFNITYMHEGNLLGIEEVQNLLASKGPSSVAIKYYGARSYPVRIDNYYIDWRPIFSNAYVIDKKNNFWAELPPFRWWYGPKYYYFGDNLLLWANAANRIYFLFIVVIPIIMTLLFSMILFLKIKKPDGDLL